MDERSPEEIRREIEAEREQLGTAVDTMRTDAGALARKLAFVAIGAAAVRLAVRMLRRRG